MDYLSWRDVVKLEDNGELPAGVVALWSIQNGDPVKAARWVPYKFIICIANVLAFLLFAWLTFYVWWTDWAPGHPGLFQIIVGLICVIWGCLSLTGLLYAPSVFAEFKLFGFGKAYPILRTWLIFDAKKLSKKPVKMQVRYLRRLGRNRLNGLALDVATEQAKHPVPLGFGTEKERLTDELKNGFDSLKPFSLAAAEGYKPYFDWAESKISGSAASP